MSSHVLVGDGSPGRTHKIIVTPSTSLIDIFHQACKKFNLSPEGRTLKKANTGTSNPLDLSLTVKLANLPAGAKLIIIPAPRSQLVNIALQVMDSGAPIPRISDKFLASTTLWGILRHFEKISKEQIGKDINLTERAASAGTKDGGRIVYTRPVVQILNKELSTLDELACTLSMLGLNSGSSLLRVKFQVTDVPFERAMEEIGIVFGGADKQEEAAATTEGSKDEPPAQKKEVLNPAPAEASAQSEQPVEANTPPEQEMEIDTPSTEEQSVDSPAMPKTPTPTPVVQVYKPTSAPQPTDFDEGDYEIDATRARIHQEHLQIAARGQRLLSDKEIEEKKQERLRKLENIRLEVRVRFPDGLMIQKSFSGRDTSEDLYSFVRSSVRSPEQQFSLFLSPPHRTIPEDKRTLAKDHSFSPRTLVNFSWSESVPKSVKEKPALREEYVSAAKDVPLPGLQGKEEEEESKNGKGGRSLGGGLLGGGSSKGNGGGSGSGGGSKKLPKWFSLGRK